MSGRGSLASGGHYLMMERIPAASARPAATPRPTRTACSRSAVPGTTKDDSVAGAPLGHRRAGTATTTITRSCGTAMRASSGAYHRHRHPATVPPRRPLRRQAGSYAKVAEFQRRGIVHLTPRFASSRSTPRGSSSRGRDHHRPRAKLSHPAAACTGFTTDPHL